MQNFPTCSTQGQTHSAEQVHVTHLQSGLESTVTFLRQKVWIPNLRQRFRSAIHRSTICHKVSGKPYRAPGSPPLPKDRLRESPPFTVTGVDVIGALYIKEGRKPGKGLYLPFHMCKYEGSSPRRGIKSYRRGVSTVSIKNVHAEGYDFR